MNFVSYPASRFRIAVAGLFSILVAATLSNAQDKPKDPERWEKDIAAFEARDTKSSPPADVLLFVGSSSIRMWDLDKSWPNTKTLNNGFGGSTLADSVHYFERLIAPYDPAAILVYAGDNDVAKGLDARQTAADFKKLAGLIESKFPEVPVIYIAIKPSQSRWDMWPTMNKANKRIAKQCRKDPQLYFADIGAPMLEDTDGAPGDEWFVEDGLHLSEKGYAAWTEVVNASLREAGVID